MSGHSRSANIKHRKEKNDATRGKILTVVGKEIVVAVKRGGPGPTDNSKLQNVIAKARAGNVSNDTISNDVKRATGGLDSVNYEQNVYEGYGPSGVMIITETLTDNRNHTATNVRMAFSKGDGNVNTPDRVPFMFDHEGQIITDKEECEMDPSEFTTFTLGAGTEDFTDSEDNHEVLTDPEQLSAVRRAFEQKGAPVPEADAKMIPQNWVSLKSEESQKKMQHTLDLLDEDNDVQAVFHSWDEE